MMRRYLNDGWIFHKKWQDAFAGGFSEEGEQVRLPHTAGEFSYHYFDEKAAEGEFGYQRQLKIPRELAGNRLILCFKGVAYSARVYINGREIKSHACAFTAFLADISEYVSYGGNNLISVYVDSRRSSAGALLGEDWDEPLYGGIFRDVYLDIRHPVHMTDVFLQPTLFEEPKTRGMSLERLKNVRMTGNIISDVFLSVEALERLKQRRLSICQFLNGKQISNQPLPLNFRTTTLAGQVHLWDTASPVCYELRTELRLDGETVDVHSSAIGFRDIRFRGGGFFLNGRRLSIRGLIRRQCYPYMGYAMPGSIQYEDARILKQELGCNAVRSAYAPPSSYFLDGCDKYGVLALLEMPGKGRIFEEDALTYLPKIFSDVIREHRNHPSVILWGVHTDCTDDGTALFAELKKDAKKLDASREVIDLSGDKGIHIEASYGGSYEDRIKSQSMEPDMRQLLIHAGFMNEIGEGREKAGGFGEAMCDHPSTEPFAEPDGIRRFGIMDSFRNPKTAAGLYASATGLGEALFTAGDFSMPESQDDKGRENYILTNAQSVRMYLGDSLLKEYVPGHSRFKNMRHGPIPVTDYIGEALKDEGFPPLKERLVKVCLNDLAASKKTDSTRIRLTRYIINRFYNTGDKELKRLYRSYISGYGGGRGYRFEAVNDGKVVSELKIARPEKIHLITSVSKSILEEDNGYDAVLVRVQAVDGLGNRLYSFDESLFIEAAGSIELIGPEYVPFRRGAAGFFIRSKGESGKGAVRIKAQGIEPVALGFLVKGAL